MTALEPGELAGCLAVCLLPDVDGWSGINSRYTTIRERLQLGSRIVPVCKHAPSPLCWGSNVFLLPFILLPSLPPGAFCLTANCFAQTLVEQYPLDAGSRVVSYLPLSHIAAQVCCFLLPLVAHVTVVDSFPLS